MPPISLNYYLPLSCSLWIFLGPNVNRFGGWCKYHYNKAAADGWSRMKLINMLSIFESLSPLIIVPLFSQYQLSIMLFIWEEKIWSRFESISLFISTLAGLSFLFLIDSINRWSWYYNQIQQSNSLWDSIVGQTRSHRWNY